jgi:hypothetical protein
MQGLSHMRTEYLEIVRGQIFELQKKNPNVKSVCTQLLEEQR